MNYIEAANAALEKRARLSEQRKAVLEDGALSDAEKRSRYEGIDTEMQTLFDEARSHVAAADSEAEVRTLNERAAVLAGGRGERRQVAERDEAAELRELAQGKREVVDFDFRTAQSGVAANAGNTKQTTFVAQVLEAMRERSEFFSYATVMNTSGGEVMEWPVKNALNPATAPLSGAAQVAENTAYGKGDQAWSKTNIGAYKYGVIAEATEEIVSDSELPILSIISSDAGESVADVVMTDLMVGSGTSKPWGWVTRATTSGVNAATIAGITFDNVLDLQYSLRAPYRRRGIYMFNDALNPILRKLKDSNGRYLWEPAVQAGMPDTVWGKPVITDVNIPTAGANAKVGVFGDPKKYLIRQVKNLRVVRSDEYGYDRDVVAYKVTWRGSGDLFDLNSVKALTVTN